jgi:hypothetical protein
MLVLPQMLVPPRLLQPRLRTAVDSSISPHRYRRLDSTASLSPRGISQQVSS